jgi:radical SAM superfamily enzyme YgiQ (UPF0313 family)
MKVLLVRPKFTSLVSNLEPLGLEYLGGVLNSLAVPYSIYDEFQFSRLFLFTRLVKTIKKGSYNIIGFHSNPNSVDYINNYARRLKKRFPNIKIVVGGPHAEMNHKDFHNDYVDFTYYDSDLLSFKALCENEFNLDYIQSLPGISYKKDGRWISNKKGKAINDYLVKPDRTHFYKYKHKYFIFCKKSFALMKASFSCPYNCSLCYCRKLNNGVYTERKIEDVVEEVAQLNHDRIWFVDDSFLLNKERLIKFCNLIIEKGIKKQFMAYTRADFVVNNPDILPLLYQAGFRDLQIGLEAVSDELLKEYNKKVTADINALAVKYLNENNIVCNGLFVLSQDSTKKDFKNLMKFIKETKLLWVTFAIFTPFKGIDSYHEYEPRLKTRKTKKFDCLHLTIKPKHMSSFMFYVRFYGLYLRTYPKIILRTLRGNAYNTHSNGWWK